MGLNIVAASSFAGGAIVKPAEHMLDLAILVEPKSIARQVPSTYQGVTRYRDEVTADVTFFKTSESLDKREPSEVVKGARFVHGMLTDFLDKVLASGPDKAVVVVIIKTPTKGGAGYAFRPASDEATAAVSAYANAREAALEAAVADAPDF